MDESLYIRQTGLIHPDRLQMPIDVVGAGSIGSWTALALLKLGCGRLSVWDHDTVERHNAATQIYTPAETGQTKVEAMNRKLSMLVDTLPEIHATEWTPEVNLSGEVLIMAVDSIDVRRAIYEKYKGTTKFFIDGRMGGNSLFIYTVSLERADECAAYEKTLFPESEALPIPCSERSVVYNGFVIAGLITAALAKHANGKDTPLGLEVDLFNFTMAGGLF